MKTSLYLRKSILGEREGVALKFFEKINDKWHHLTYVFKKVKPFWKSHEQFIIIHVTIWTQSCNVYFNSMYKSGPCHTQTSPTSEMIHLHSSPIPLPTFVIKDNIPLPVLSNTAFNIAKRLFIFFFFGGLC